MLATREVWENGVAVSRETDDQTNSAFDIQRIDCLHCTKTFLIRDTELFRLEREILLLKQQLADLTPTSWSQ